MNRHVTLGVGLVAGAAAGYVRVRRQAPFMDLPLALRIRAALTLPPMKSRIGAARACLKGGTVLFNARITAADITGRRGVPLYVSCCDLTARSTDGGQR